MGRAALKTPRLWLKYLEFAFNAVAFGMSFKYGLMNLSGSASRYVETVRLEIGVVAAVAFPFIILPVCIHAIVVNPKRYYKMTMDPMFSCAGLICNVVQGALMLDNVAGLTLRFDPDNIKTKLIVTGAMFICAAAAYLIDFIVYFAIRRKMSNN